MILDILKMNIVVYILGIKLLNDVLSGASVVFNNILVEDNGLLNTDFDLKEYVDILFQFKDKRY